MIHHIEVENIKCGGCMNTIRQSIQKLEGVKSVEIREEIKPPSTLMLTLSVKPWLKN